MAATYEPIASTTLGSDAASLTISGIAGTFTDLRLVVTGRSSWTTDPYETLSVRFNSDTGSNYSYTRLMADGTNPVNGRASNTTAAPPVRLNPSYGGNTNPSVGVIDIFSYSNSNVYKTFLGRSSTPNEARPVNLAVCLWRSTSAITSITVFATQSANLKSGFTLSLYGIKAA